MFHTADPTAFFKPIDAENERYEELAAHPDWGFSSAPVSKQTLLEPRNRVIALHPATTFIGAHCAESSEDLGFLAEQMDALPNLLIDISARTPELGASLILLAPFSSSTPTAFFLAPTFCPRSRCTGFITASSKQRMSISNIPRMSHGRAAGRLMATSFLKRYCARSIGKTR